MKLPSHTWHRATAIVVAGLTLAVLAPFLSAQTPPSTRPATSPATTRAAGWDKTYFAYQRPETLRWAASTPTDEQVVVRGRPPTMTQLPAKPATRAASKRVGAADVVHLAFVNSDGAVVTALLCTPTGQPGPFPLVIAVHGLRSHKAQVIAQIGPALAKNGFAVLAIDVALHGERPGDPRELFDEPAKLPDRFRRSVMDVRQAIDLAEALPGLDLSRGVILAGYSMGSWISSVAGPADDRVAAMLLMVGGSLDVGPLAAVMRDFGKVEPTVALPEFAPRPVLMLNGTDDRTVTPAMARRLFEAAREPKEIRWVKSGHFLPAATYDEGARWVAQTWAKLKPAAAK